MIYGSLLKIKPRVVDDVLWEQDDPLYNKSVDCELDFTPIKELQYNSTGSAIKSFSQFISTLDSKTKKETYAIALRPQKELRLAREVTLIQFEDGAIRSRFVVNPLWAGHNPTKRSTKTHGLNFPLSPALQSQMFAMLESGTADGKWLQNFKLNDKQQEAMYIWQEKHFPKKNVMSTWDMMGLMKNVLNVARLPWIKLEFVKNSKVCAFSISGDDGKVVVIGDGNEDGSGSWDWLQNPTQDNFEIVGNIDKGRRIKISSMKLTMAIEWAMSPALLLHELAHYIAFCMPTPYRLNQGEEKMSFLEYESLFSGHGSFYMAILTRLFVDFMYIKPEPLYRSIEEDGLEYFKIKSLKVEDINHALTAYLREKKG